MESRIITNQDITVYELERIISLKNEHWPYGYESQLNWMRQNLYAGDLHMLLTEGTQLCAYLNIVQLDVQIDNITYQMYGIGNVCVDKQIEHTGIGKKLIAEFNRYVNNGKAVLLCKPELVGFYKKCNWTEIYPNHIQVAGVAYQNRIMVYDESMCVPSQKIDKLTISRNF